MLASATHPISVDEYYRMAKTGILPPGARVELLDGKIFDTSPIGPFHGNVTDYLTEAFVTSSQGRWITRVQNPVQLNDFSEPQPDLMLLKRIKNGYRRRHPTAEDVYLLIEVCDTTPAFDVQEKLPAYSRAGVAEVWLVNLTEPLVEVYREPRGNEYASKTILRPGEFAQPAVFPDVAINLAEMLK